MHSRSILATMTCLMITVSAQAGIFTTHLTSDKGVCISDDGQYEMSYKKTRVYDNQNLIQNADFKYEREVMTIRSLKENSKFDGIELDSKGRSSKTSYSFIGRSNGYSVSVKVPDSKGNVTTITGACEMDMNVRSNDFFEMAKDSHYGKSEIGKVQKNIELVIPAATIIEGNYANAKGSDKSALQCHVKVKSSLYSKGNIAAQKVTLKPVAVGSDNNWLLEFKGDTQNEWLEVSCYNAYRYAKENSNIKSDLPSVSEQELYESIKAAFPAGYIL